MDRLAELRERRALTLRELSEMSGVAADTINQIELGHRKPRPSTLRKLAKALEVDVEEFYREPALPLADAPQGVDVVPNSLEELLEQHGTNTRHLANENLAATLAQRPLEEVLQILREISEELEAIGPDLTRLAQLRGNPEAMRLFAEVSRQSWIARLALPARQGQKFVQVWPELESEIDETARRFEESRAMAGVA